MMPQQELFTACLLALKEKYPDHVYDTVLPPPDTPYPFIYLSRSSTANLHTKTGRCGTVTQIFKVWHNDPEKRGTVSRMCQDIEETAGSIKETGSYSWSVRDITTEIEADSTVTPPLLMGTVTCQLQFS